MDHASVSTTDGIYGHMYPVDHQHAYDRFEAFVAERKETLGWRHRGRSGG
jgi:hypothetical protein